MAQHLLDARADAFGPPLGVRVGVRAELQVDAPDVVGLLVQQRRLARMERRREPEPALGREIGGHLHVGDQELVLEGLTPELESEHGARRRARPVAGDDPRGLDAIVAAGRRNGQERAVVARLQRGKPVAPAQVDQRLGRRGLGQRGLDVILLKIDEGRLLVAVLGQQVEIIELVLAAKDAAAPPSHALIDHGLGQTQPVEDFQRALGARALADAVAVVDQHDGNGATREIERQRQADGAGSDDDNRVMRRDACVLIGRAAIGELAGRHQHASVLTDMRYAPHIDPMIASFADRATEDVFLGRETKAAWRCIERIVKRKLDVLDAATALRDLRSPLGNRLESLKGDRKGQWSIRINDQWRICFRWDGDWPEDVVIVDYH
jgi:toxin HigB-1